MKKLYDKLYIVVDRFDLLLESVDDILRDNTFNWVMPLNKLVKQVKLYNSDYAYSSFDQIPKTIESYNDLINKAIELKLATRSSAQKEVEQFLTKIVEIIGEKVSNLSFSEDFEIAKHIVYIYTRESLFYKLINHVLKDLNNANIESCGIWIKALNLALKNLLLYEENERKNCKS